MAVKILIHKELEGLDGPQGRPRQKGLAALSGAG
jgi:hypothetical protein